MSIVNQAELMQLLREELEEEFRAEREKHAALLGIVQEAVKHNDGATGLGYTAIRMEDFEAMQAIVEQEKKR